MLTYFHVDMETVRGGGAFYNEDDNVRVVLAPTRGAEGTSGVRCFVSDKPATRGNS